MRNAPMSTWLRAGQNDIWEQVDRRTYGTADQDEDVLWLAHARIEHQARLARCAESDPQKRRTSVTEFPEVARRRKVG